SPRFAFLPGASIFQLGCAVAVGFRPRTSSTPAGFRPFDWPPPRGGARGMAVAIVTGGNSGIGRATAVALAQAGFDLGITWHREEERALDTAREVQETGVRCELRRL